MDKELLRRDRSALVEILTAAGAKFKGNTCTCIFHADQRPSAGIHQGKDGVWRYKCFAGNCPSGDIYDMQAAIKNKPLSEVLPRKAPEKAPSISHTSTPLSNAPKTPPSCSPGTGQDDKVYPTIDSLVTAVSNQGTPEAFYDYYDASGNLVLLVLRIKTAEGKSIRQAKPVQGGYIFKAPPKPFPLYHLPEVIKSDRIIIAEGEKCVDILRLYGLTATTSAGGAQNAAGTSWEPLAGKNIVIWRDCDAAGLKYQNDVIQILEKLEPAPVISVINPADLDLIEGEDCADLIEQLKTLQLDENKISAELADAIDSAKVVDAAHQLADRFQEIESGKQASLDLPHKILTRSACPLWPGELTVICGPPGCSKSLLMIQCLLFWRVNGIKACCYMLENDKLYHLNRALAQIEKNSCIADLKFIADNADLVNEALLRNQNIINDLAKSIWEIPQDQDVGIDNLIDWAEARAREGHRIICVDPITMVDYHEETFRAHLKLVRKLQRIARKYQITVVVVTHPAKGQSEYPSLDSLAGGASFTRFTDVVLWVEHHEFKQAEMRIAGLKIQDEINRTIHILKSRNGVGIGCRIGFKFNEKSLCFEEVGVIVKPKSKKTD